MNAVCARRERVVKLNTCKYLNVKDIIHRTIEGCIYWGEINVGTLLPTRY